MTEGRFHQDLKRWKLRLRAVAYDRTTFTSLSPSLFTSAGCKFNAMVKRTGFNEGLKALEILIKASGISTNHELHKFWQGVASQRQRLLDYWNRPVTSSNRIVLLRKKKSPHSCCLPGNRLFWDGCAYAQYRGTGVWWVAYMNSYYGSLIFSEVSRYFGMHRSVDGDLAWSCRENLERIKLADGMGVSVQGVKGVGGRSGESLPRISCWWYLAAPVLFVFSCFVWPRPPMLVTDRWSTVRPIGLFDVSWTMAPRVTAASGLLIILMTATGTIVDWISVPS